MPDHDNPIGRENESIGNPPPVPPVRTAHTNPANDDPHQDPQRWWQQPPNWGHILHAVTIAVGLGVAWIYWMQLDEMSKQTKLLNEQANRSVIENIGNAATGARQIRALEGQVNAIKQEMGISERAWREMQTQTGIQRDAAVNSERAWVGMDEPLVIDALEIIPRLKVESHYSIRNFGHGPALKVVVTGFFVTDGKQLDGMAKAVCDFSTHFATGTVPLGPGLINPGPMGFTLFPNQPHNETIGSPADPWQGDAEPNLKHFWFIGCMAYIDQFKVARWTRFCVEPNFYVRHAMNKDIPLKFCALYNDTGNIGETKQH